ncbi:MAG: GDSL-type esterase/lipase family protein [Candidatus Bathyarchaeota archaeon]|nr:GDSL-type esterase/lipase family protein [Candidatus Bathyarchaeota archaeon]
MIIKWVKNRKVQQIGLLCISILFTLMIAEGVLYGVEEHLTKRLAGRYRFDLYKELYMVSPNKDVSYEHRPNVNIVFESSRGEFFTMRVVTNSAGLREESDIPFEKPKNVKRIIGLGDSVVFGASVDNDETLLRAMEGYLSNEEFTVQTINFGVGGSNTRLQYHFLKYKKAASYSPDIILLGFYLNDFDTRYIVFDPELGNWHFAGGSIIDVTKGFLAKSRLLRLLNAARLKFLETPKDKPDVDAGDRQKQELAHWLKQIKEYSREHNAHFIVIVLPLKQQLAYALQTQDMSFESQKAIKEICEQLKIPCYDLLPDLIDYLISHGTNLDEFYWDEGHPWREGYQAIGRFTATWILKNQWLEN